jgi:hypothetical protein
MSGDLFVVLSFTAGAIVLIAIIAWVRAFRDVPLDGEQLRSVQSKWQPPDELRSQAGPRDVRLTSAGRTTFTIVLTIGVVLVIAGLMLIPGMRRSQQETDLIRTEGAPGMATVTGRWVTTGKHWSYHLVYDYEVGEGRYRGQSEVSRLNYDRSVQGAAVRIHYLPSNPDVSRMDDGLYTSPWFTLVLFIPAVFLLIMPWRLWQLKNLLASGTAVGAIVTRTTKTKSGRSIRYQFLDPTGQLVIGTDVVPSIMAPQPGDVITVLFDPNRAVKTASYPMRYVELNRP